MFTLLNHNKTFVNSPKPISLTCLHLKYEQDMYYFFNLRITYSLEHAKIKLS